MSNKSQVMGESSNLISVSEALNCLQNSTFDESCESRTHFIRELVNRVDIKEETPESISCMFFDSEDLKNDRVNNGVVETPSKIADLMISSSVTTYLNCTLLELDACRFLPIRWLDPCVGAGIFPLAILKFYLNRFGVPADVVSLPIIMVMDVSHSAVFLCLCSIKSALSSIPVTLDDYISSGRLSFKVGDSLFRYSEQCNFESDMSRYDIVIGNPPYVRSSRLSKKYRDMLKLQFPNVYYGSADLYMYFIASGLLCLDNLGVLAFISPASFIRTKSGSTIRSYITSNSSIRTFIDLDETKVFKNADVHSSIYVLKKGCDQSSDINYMRISSDHELDLLCNSQAEMGSSHLDLPKDHGWSFHKSSHSRDSYRSKFEGCKALTYFGFNIYSGVRPGVAKAYILTKDKGELLTKSAGSNWVKPIVLPANICKWNGSKSINYLVFVPHDALNIPNDIIAHLSQFKESLAKRSEVKTDTDWCKLRTCAYYDKMMTKKIVFPDLSAKQRFSLCDSDTFIADGSYFIDTNDLVLLGILNSDIAKIYFVNRCSSVGNLESNGRFRFKKSYVQNFPLPNNFFTNIDIRYEIQTTVQDIISLGETQERLSRLNDMVSKFYGIQS